MGDGPRRPVLAGQIQATEVRFAMPPAVSPSGDVSTDDAAVAGSAALDWARSGRLSIDPDEGQNLVNTLNAEIANLRDRWRSADQLEKETRLGETPNAPKFARFNQDVAVAGPHALVPNHDLLLDSLGQLSHAVRLAMDNYRNAEQANSHRFKGMAW